MDKDSFEEQAGFGGDIAVYINRRKERMLTPEFGTVEHLDKMNESGNQTDRRMVDDECKSNDTGSETESKKSESQGQKEHKKKKSSKKKNKKSGSKEKSKFAEYYAKALDHANSQVDQAQPVDPDAVAISLIPNAEESDKYNENIMHGLNIVSYLQSDQVPIGNKLFYIGIILLLIAGYGINFWELINYATTSCIDHHSGIGMYINFFLLIFAKGGIFNYITSEINANLQYDLKFPFIIPILAVGVVANFQLPLVIFNYEKCQLRSPILRMSFGYFIVNILAAIFIVLIFIMVLAAIFSSSCKIPNSVTKMTRTICYFIGISGMILMNALFVFISLSQIQYFSRTLLIENLIYWILILTGCIVYILRKKWSFMVFAPVPDIEEEKKVEEEGDQTPRMVFEESKKDPSPTQQQQQQQQQMKSVLKRELEKIDESESENERSGSGLKPDINLEKPDEFVISVGSHELAAQNQRRSLAPVYREG